MSIFAPDTVWEIPRNMRGAIQSTFTLLQDAVDDVSPWTNERSNYALSALWVAEIKPPQAPGPAKALPNEATWRDWQGFMTRLKGTTGKLRTVDYFRMRPTYDARSAPTKSNWADGSLWTDGQQWLTGALPPYVTLAERVAADDESFVLRGLPPNTEAVLNPSDLIELRPNGVPTPYCNLYEVIHCARTTSTGRARVYVAPGVVQPFPAGDMAVLRCPTAVLRLADKSQGVVTRTLGNMGSLGFKLFGVPRDA